MLRALFPVGVSLFFVHHGGREFSVAQGENLYVCLLRFLQCLCVYPAKANIHVCSQKRIDIVLLLNEVLHM